MEKMANGLPIFRIPKISKQVQEKYDKIKNKLYKANRHWNDCKFQLNCNNLEWENPRIKTKRKKSIQFLQRKFLLIKILEHTIGLAVHY